MTKKTTTRKTKTSKRRRAQHLEQTADMVNQYLFTGHAFGGKSVVEALTNYEKHGMFHPCRIELVHALTRALLALVELDAVILTTVREVGIPPRIYRKYGAPEKVKAKNERTQRRS